MEYYDYATQPAQEGRPSNRLKLLLIVGVLLLVVTWFAVTLLRNLSLAQIVVTTNNSKNSITLSQPLAQSAGDGEGEPVSSNAKLEQLQNGKAIRIKPGTYLVNVQGQDPNSAKSQVIQVKSRQTYHYAINLAAVASPSFVANLSTQIFSVSNSNITYVDKDTQDLRQLSNSNTITDIAPGKTFIDVEWAGQGYGVGKDTQGNLFVIDNGSVKPLAPPNVTTNSNTIIAIDAAREIYIATNNDVYKGTPVSGFQHLTTTPHQPTLLLPTQGHIALVYYAGNGSANTASQITVVADDGKTVQKNVEAYDAAWSPNGNYFLTTNDSNTQVFDSSLNPIAVVPNNNVNSPLWLTNDTLLYMINNQVWEYSVSTGTSEIVAATPANRGIVDAALSPDASYVYLAVQDKPGSNDSYSLLRVAFKGQSANTNTIQKLQPQFPWLLGSCYLQLINYGTPPAVLVTDSSTSSVPVDCSGLAQTYVQQFGVDPSQLQYVNSDLSIDQSISQ